MSFLEKLEKFKSKKQLLEELEYYNSLITKNKDLKDFKTALEKVNSAITLIQEYDGTFDLDKELFEIAKIKTVLQSELQESQDLYFRRYDNLSKETLTESNLENFLKLLVMLKEEIDTNSDKLLLNDLSNNINQYFRFTNRVYVLVHTYKLLNYHNAYQKILSLVTEIKDREFPNLKTLIFSIFQNLLTKQLFGFSKQSDKLTLKQLSNLLRLDSSRLRHFINLIMETPNNPIEAFNPNTQEVIFRKLR